MVMPLEQEMVERLRKARQYGFRQCLDLIKDRVAECDSIDELIDELDRIESRIKEKQIIETAEEYLLV